MRSTVDAPSSSKRGLEALYVINKEAKKRAMQSDASAFVSPTRSVARQRQKEALYGVKRAILKDIYSESERIEVHEIADEEFYCFYFGEWSFHTPTAGFCGGVDVAGRITMTDFETSCSVSRVQLSLRDALRRAYVIYGVNANSYFDSRYVPSLHGELDDVGWPCIGVEE
jgi:hypothetical protein